MKIASVNVKLEPGVLCEGVTKRFTPGPRFS